MEKQLKTQSKPIKGSKQYFVQTKTELDKQYAKARREHQKSLTPEEKERQKQYREFDRYQREQARKEKDFNRKNKRLVKREIQILKFMLKTGIEWHHHHRIDTINESTIQKAIDSLRSNNRPKVYDPYIWNWQGQGQNYMWCSLLNHIYDMGDTEFDTIHDVPLDGTYKFIVYDSGQRGLGSFDYIKPVKVDQVFKAPFVNPGGMPPVTC